MGLRARKAVGNVALAVVVGGVAGGGFYAYRKYGSLNPYAGFKRQAAHDPTTQILVNGVRMRRYENGKLVASAEANRMTVSPGAAQLRMNHIKNGMVQSPQGKMQFAAGTGVLQPNLKTVDLANGVRVKGTDFDIATAQANLNGRIGELSVPTPLKGTFMGAQLTAAKLVHRMNTDFTRIDHPEAIGPLPPAAVAGMPVQVQSKVWHFTGEWVTHGSDDKKVTDPAVKRLDIAENGWASDGEMVITAPHLTHDGKTEIVVATGDGKTRATYHSAKADIVADKVTIYQKEKRAFCTGHVLVYVRPKSEWDKPLHIDEDDRGPLVPDIPASMVPKMVIDKNGDLSPAEKDKIDQIRSGKNLRDFPMQMAADEVTYWYKEGERHAIAKNGSPTAFQKFDDGRWRQVWAPEAHYDGEKDMLDLIGPTSKREVHLKNSIEDVTDCFTAKLSTKEDQTEEDQYVQMKSPKGHIMDFNSDKPGANAAAKGGAPTGKPAGAPPAKPEG